MTKIKSIIKLLFVGLILFGCSDRTNLTEPDEISTGNADFSKFITIGNSLTAGTQNNALYESGQTYSYGKLIAEQVGVEFVQPTISDPGIGGRVEIESLIPFVTKTQPEDAGSPINSAYAGIYNNLGVPGALVGDILSATNSQTATFTSNVFFDIILREQGTVLDQAMLSEPTIATLWIGNNDILGYATNGGTFPYTQENTFATKYDQLCSALSTGNFPVVLANIPRFKFIPFLTTVGPSVGLMISDAQIINPEIEGLVYQTTADPFIAVATVNNLINNEILLTLRSSIAASYIGDVEGTYYSSTGTAIPASVNTAFPFGLSPENPFPNKFVLDESEQLTLDLVTASYNASIAGASLKYNFHLIDLHDFFNEVSQGYTADGITFTNEYIYGGMFSLDGVHPTSQGYGIIANLFIEKINSVLDAEIPLIRISTIPGSIELAKKGKVIQYGLPIFDEDSFNSIFY